ncbi:MAG: ferrous iron transporter B [Bdellovibrionaceae bacterium]|jgi:ferrous iron transport protein B|nr:ferrous iron transporter B [Pseudobdellovibrionaceae bacterium]
MKKVALVGPPNAGKTSLFNWLTGSNFKTVNYPGATVNFFRGDALEQYGFACEFIDTPGVYSLFPKSQDEEITQKILIGENSEVSPDQVIVVIDATQFERHLNIFHQVSALNIPTIVAVTMLDILKESGQSIDLNILSKELGVPVVGIDGLLGGGVQELMDSVAGRESEKSSQIEPEALQKWTQEIFTEFGLENNRLHKLSFIDCKSKRNWHHLKVTDKLDKFLLHPIFGLVFFVVVMSLLFTSIYSFSVPLMDFVDAGFSSLSQYILVAGEQSLWAQFLADGVVTGFGAFFIFVPQVAILFFGLILLEDTGYLARATTLVDRPLSLLGMNGRSFVPLLSGYACAVPAAMAARTITNKKERLLTLFVLPLMNCSARLPVYALLLTFFFTGKPMWYGGVALAAIYFLSIIVGALAALILRRFIKDSGQSLFMMELPLYRRPRIMPVLSQVLAKTKFFVRKAGPIIFALSLVIWVTSVFPNYEMTDDVQRLQSSYIAQAGHLMEPVFEPMGVDWRVGVGIISAFAAREVFVSALALVFNVTEENAIGGDGSEESVAATLLEKMKTAKLANGGLIFTPATIIGLIIFFMIALQCLATVGVIYQETNSVRFTVFQLVSFNVVAYLLAVGVQIFA